MRQNIDDVEKEADRTAAKERMKKIRTANNEEREEAFEEVQGMSKVDPSILSTKAFDIIKQDFKSAIAEGTTYRCDICIKWEYKGNGKHSNRTEYEKLLKSVIQRNQIGYATLVIKQ